MPPARASLVASTAVLMTIAVSLANPTASLGAGGGSGLPAGVTDAALTAARASEPVVLNGAQVPGWAQPAATGVAAPYPSGHRTSRENGEPNVPGKGLRSAHNGTLVVPPDNPAVPDINPNQVAAYSWTNGAWKQVPVQVDKMFLNFLANGRSSFGIYSGTDEELTYAWGQDAHDIGHEAWKRMFPSPLVDPAPAAGGCSARFATSLDEVHAAINAGLITLGAGETATDYLRSMQDPQKSFDTDDQLSFMAGDAGEAAPERRRSTAAHGQRADGHGH